jgi:RNA polymerase sigma-70 factor (ECF subfamily)
MTEQSSFADVLARLRAGDESAAGAIFQRFAAGLLVLARSQLDSWVRLREDPEDVVQSVYKSFFSQQARGQFELTSWNELWGLLTLMTLRKCADRVEYLRAKCRDVAREVSSPPQGGDPGIRWEALERAPSPEEAAVLTETVHQLLARLEGDDRTIIQLSLEGYTTEEIRTRLGLSERTVRRVRERTKKRLERLQAEDGA